jgi:hypothetical protein
MTKPQIRTVQANPTLGISERTMAGYTRPPVEDPVAAMPIAMERFVVKYVARSATVGQNWRPFPIPWAKP